MKELTRDVLISACLGLLLPGLLLQFASAVWDKAVADQQAAAEETVHMQETALPVKVRNADGLAREEDMDGYLVGVVLAEMPAWFEDEALKAQAVVARTYARKAWETGGKHDDGSVCTEPACCQDWISEEDYLDQGGSREDVEKIRSAVHSTSGQVLTYDGELIEATYFSCSGGRTEDAEAVWGADFPYLQAVDSPGEENAAPYEDTAEFTPSQLEEMLGIVLTGRPETWVGPITRTDGGGVDTIVIGGNDFTGTELRSLLGLRSTAFTVSASEDSVVFSTKGFGHRVGMSQYGADAMAVAGSTYGEILSHYYQGTELTQLKGS